MTDQFQNPQEKTPPKETVTESEDPNGSDRPTQLSYQRTRVVEGRHYIDTSEDSSLDGAQDETANSSGDLVSFVAADLQERIRLSSPPPSVDSAGVTTGSSSSSPSPYPPLIPDPQVLFGLEHQAQQISVQLDRVIQEFKGSLHGMTDLTLECAEAYCSSISKTCDHVDSSIKSTYQLLAKAEELTQILKPIPRLAQQIREIKRILDLFESHMQKTVG